MIVEINSDIWRKVYDVIALEIFATRASINQHELKNILWKDYGMLVMTDRSGRWEKVYMDEDEITMYLLKWSKR